MHLIIKETIKKKFKKHEEFLYFLVAGTLNTGFTYLVYLMLLSQFYYGLAYGVSYMLGIICMYFMNVFFVFKTEGNTKKMILFPLVYVAQFIINYCVLYLMVDYVGWGEKIAPLIVIIFSLPVTFVLSRFILK